MPVLKFKNQTLISQQYLYPLKCLFVEDIIYFIDQDETILYY